MNAYELIILFFGFQSFILALLFLLRQKGSRIANCLLAALLLVFAFNIVFNTLFWTKQLLSHPYVHLTTTYQLAMALYGGLFFLYARSAVQNKSINRRDFIHFTPFLFLLFSRIPYLLLPSEKKLALIKTGSPIQEYMLVIPYIDEVLCLLMFVYGTYTYVSQVKGLAKDRDLKTWLTMLSSTYLLFAFSFILYYVFVHMGILKIEYDYFLSLFMVLFVGLVSYFAFHQAEIFNGKSIEEIIPLAKKKYANTGLSDSASILIKHRIDQLMASKKPYLESNMRLDQFAKMLDLPRHHVSQVINEQYGLPFQEFINQYRIDEAKSLLIEKANLSVKEVVYASGFNTKSAFYQAFKIATGSNPGAWRKSTPKENLR